MSKIVLSTKWDLITADQADRWLRTNGVAPKEAKHASYLLANKLSALSLQRLSEQARLTGNTLIDQSIEWLKLYTIKQFGCLQESVVTDVTNELPVAGMVANGIDVVRLTPQLIGGGSAIGIKTIREFAGDYVHDTNVRPILGNGILAAQDKPSVVVTNQDLISRGLVVPPPNPIPYIELLAHANMHRTIEVWSDRMIKRANCKIELSDLQILSVKNKALATALGRKLGILGSL